MVRLTYVVAGKPWTDVLHPFAELPAAVRGKNPFKQLPYVETAEGDIVWQTLAIMHHVGRGTSAWPSDPRALTEALAVGMGGYDLYQWFGGFAADDAPAKKRFEGRRAPQFFNGLGEIYGQRRFATGEVPTFADCIVYEAVGWCARRNDVCRELLAATPALSDFMARFAAVPELAAFMARQAAAREVDDSV
jgi:glutathione S-transferase